VISSDNPEGTDYVRRRARALVYTLLYSGLRISDVAALERSALDTATRHLTLRVLKTGVRQKVLLHPNAAAALTSLPAQHPKYFFWTGNGDIETCIKNLRRTVQRLGTIAKVHAHPHRFRDTFAVELLTNGADIRTVQQLLGHTSVRTTEKHYAHFVAAHQALLDSAAATLDFERGNGGPLLVHTGGNRRRNP
jgi:integrase/recombinase XerD